MKYAEVSISVLVIVRDDSEMNVNSYLSTSDAFLCVTNKASTEQLHLYRCHYNVTHSDSDLDLNTLNAYWDPERCSKACLTGVVFIIPRLESTWTCLAVCFFSVCVYKRSVCVCSILLYACVCSICAQHSGPHYCPALSILSCGTTIRGF